MSGCTRAREKQAARLFARTQILYCSGVWSYIVASIATPTFIIVPLATIWIGIFPIVLSMDAAIGLSAYYVATVLVSWHRDRAPRSKSSVMKAMHAV